MSLFKLDLKSKDVPTKVALGVTHTAAMAGNASYPAATRVPSDAQVAAAQLALATTHNEADAAEVIWKQKNAARNAAEDAWALIITARANNCEAVTPGNVAALTSTGLPMKGAPAPATAMGAPQNLRATAGDEPGHVDLMWDPLKGSSMNVIQHRVQGTAAWVDSGMAQQSKFTVTALVPGTLYEFQVHGVGKDGDGPWSDLAVKRAP